MFKKLVSNLPFNPGLIQQVSFYGKRLHKEQAVRKMSFLFMGATLLVNIIAFSIPAQNTLATSENDIIYGAKSKTTVLNAYDNDRDGKGRTDIQDIYNFYGITRADIANAASVNVRSNERNFTTTGRWLSPGDDDAQTIPGAQTTVYERSLRVWDIENPVNDYPAITGTATGNGKLKGQKFWILLKGCGNITYVAQPKTPKVEIKKTRLSADKLRPGSSVSYRIDYRNSGNAAATGTVIGDTLNAGLSYISASPAPSNGPTGNHLEWNIGNLEPSSEWHQITITASVKNIATASAEICNIAGIYTSNAGGAPSENPCFTVDNRCPGTETPAPDGDIAKCTITCPDGSTVPFNEPDKCPTPVITCVDLVLIQSPDWNQRTVRLSTRMPAGSEIGKVSFLLDGKPVGSKDNPGETEEYTYTNLSEGDHAYSVRYDIKKGDLRTSASCAINDKVTKPVPGISAIKRAKNKTKDISDANGTTASAGDIIEYSLTTTNSGTGAANGYIIKPDSLGRVLEYADMKEVGDATFDSSTQQLSWAPIDIKPGESVTKVFSVQIKSPIPTTAPSTSDPAGRQYTICNKYGNETCVKIDKPFAPAVQGTAEQLPHTGPGESLFLTFLAVCLVGFFYSRSRVLAKEIDIVRYEYSKGA
jgi:uncharacterized repeat protein (TIGR01451 family)